MRYQLLRPRVALGCVFALVCVLLSVQPAAATGSWLPVKIAGAPAVEAVNIQNQSQLQVVRGDDNRIFFSVNNLADEANQFPYGWLEVPGGGRTPYQLALHSDRSAQRTYLAAVGMDGLGIWVQYYTWKTGQWSGTWVNYGGVFSSPPEITVFNNEITVLGAAKADGNKLYYRRQKTNVTVDPAGSNWHRWESPIVTTQKVAARYYEATAGSNSTRLLVAVRGNDGKIYNAEGVPVTGGGYQTNSVWYEVAGGGLTNNGLAMAEWSTDDDGTPDVVWLAARGTAGGVFYQTYQNGCWKGQEFCPVGGWSAFPTQGQTDYGPSMYTLGTTTGFAGPVVAVTEVAAQNFGVAFQITRPDIPSPAGAYSHFKLKAAPGYAGWFQVANSDYGVPNSGTHPDELAAGWNPNWKDENGNPVPSPVNGPNAAQFSEPVNQWYPWCMVLYDQNGFPNGQKIQQWMSGENQNAAFADLVAWLDIYHPVGGGPGIPPKGFLEQNGDC